MQAAPHHLVKLVHGTSFANPVKMAGLDWEVLRASPKTFTVEPVWPSAADSRALWSAFPLWWESLRRKTMPRSLPKRACCSSLWRASCGVWADVVCKARWVVADGRATKFRIGNWVDEIGSLIYWVDTTSFDPEPSKLSSWSCQDWLMGSPFTGEWHASWHYWEDFCPRYLLLENSSYDRIVWVTTVGEFFL